MNNNFIISYTKYCACDFTRNVLCIQTFIKHLLLIIDYNVIINVFLNLDTLIIIWTDYIFHHNLLSIAFIYDIL